MNKKQVNIKKNSIIHGFKVERVVNIKERDIIFYELEHIKTGAKYIHLANKTQENTFCVAFKTVPKDSTGVAHILEHTVLTGSKKYPVKDPFFSMLKRSLQTFMNAFTANDWTAYPFSTENKKDFYNLMSVYLDAAFFPKISEPSFMQEGCRLDYENGKLVYKGVVYNEMKGSMSSPESVMEQSIQTAIHPKTTYKNNSGGDPEDIPKLTHKALKTFHARHYHPSNAYFYSYGNLSIEKHLKFIEQNILNKFSRINPKTKIPLEPRWQKSKKLEVAYSADPNEDIKNKYQASLNWLTSQITDTKETVWMEIIEDLLIGNNAAPLRKALIDSGLGSDLSDMSGYILENRETVFSTGLKDIKKTDVIKVEKIIIKVLETLIKKGVSLKQVNTSIHKYELTKKEVSNSPYPYGLRLFLEQISPWIHGGNIAEQLLFNKEISEIKKEAKKNKFIENKIKKLLLNNKHRVLLVLKPDKNLNNKKQKQETKQLVEIQRKLKASEINKIKDSAKILQKLQEVEEDVSVLPTLELEDISKKIKKTSIYKKQNKITTYKTQTNGLFYISKAFDLQAVDQKLIFYVPLFCYILPKMGTKKYSYEELLNIIDANTGGVHLTPQAEARQDKKSDSAIIMLSTKCLEKNIIKTLNIIKEIIYNYNFSDLNRLTSYIKEYKARFEADIIQNGHNYSALLSARGFSKNNYLNEQWHGLHQYKFLQALTNNLDNKNLKRISNNLLELGRKILTNDYSTALIGDKKYFSKAINDIENIKKDLPANKRIYSKKIFNKSKIREAWSASTAVSFSACSFETVKIGHKDAPILLVTSKLLSSLYLLQELRIKKGAYGGFARYNPYDGIFRFGSYRDPHIHSTLKVYSKVINFLKQNKYTDEDIREAILAVISEIDKPGTPFETAKRAFRRQLIGLSDKKRENFRKAVLEVNKTDILSIYKKYFKNKWEDYSVAVISSDVKIRETNKRIKGRKLKVSKI